jgi:putative DNA primase/helicase
MYDKRDDARLTVRPPLPENVPHELRFLKRWVIWKPELRHGKLTKRPIGAKVNAPHTWRSFDEARAAALATGANVGVGVVLGNGIIGIDFDHCVIDDVPHVVVSNTVGRLGSYAEKSPSGSGVHVLIRGEIARARKLPATADLPARELYAEKRYFTFTGDRLPNAPFSLASGPIAQAALDEVVAQLFASQIASLVAPEDPISEAALTDDEILRLLRSSPNAAKFGRLYEGDASAYPSPSEADLALCRLVRYYSSDAAQIDRIVRGSRLHRPEKWDSRRGGTTYGAATIATALRMAGRRYTPSPLYAAGIGDASFGPIFRAVLPTLRGLTKTEILTYLAIAVHAGRSLRSWPSANKIGEALGGVEREHIQEALPHLEKSGLIAIERRIGTSSRFTLIAPGPVANFATPPEAPPHPGPVANFATPPEAPPHPEPVASFATPPVAKFAPLIKQEQIDTGRGRDYVSKVLESETADRRKLKA